MDDGDSQKSDFSSVSHQMAGGGGGALKGGRHVICPKGTPLTDLQYTMLLKLGVPVESFGGTQSAINELSSLA